jgi:hypothetical protein
MGPTCQIFLTLQDAQAASGARMRGPARHVLDDLFRPPEVPDVCPSACIACRIAYAPAAFFSGKHVLRDDLEDAVQSVLHLKSQLVCMHLPLMPINRGAGTQETNTRLPEHFSSTELAQQYVFLARKLVFASVIRDRRQGKQTTLVT